MFSSRRTPPNSWGLSRIDKKILVWQSNVYWPRWNLYHNCERQTISVHKSWSCSGVFIGKYYTWYLCFIWYVNITKVPIKSKIKTIYTFSKHYDYHIIYHGFFFHLQITDLQHSVLSPLSFRLEYKRGATTTPTMFQRQVRMQVNINDISEGNDGGSSMPVHAITFTLLSGIES